MSAPARKILDDLRRARALVIHPRDEEGAGLIDPIFDVLTHRRRCWEQEQDWVRCLREREPVTLVATGVV